MEESCIERQEEEMQALQAIYMDDFQDLREKPDEPPKVCLKLTPLQSVVAKEVYARVDLIIQYRADYPNRQVSPKLSLCNAEGISEEDCSTLQNELRKMAADLVGEEREIEEELQRRDEAMKESKRRRTVVIPEKNTKTDPAAQSAKTKDPDTSPTKEVPVQRKQSGNSVAPLQAAPSPKKAEGMPSGYNVMRRRRSSERLGDESFTGTRVIRFTSRGGHIVHCGKCLGQGSSGSKVYSGMDITMGDLVVMCEWILSSLHAGPQMRRTPSITENQQQDPQTRLMKQVFSIEQEALSLINRVSHPNLTHYLAVDVQEESPTVKVQVLSEYVGGGDLSLYLRKGGLPVAQLREYTQQLLEALCYLHSRAVVHKDLRLSSCRLDSDGNIRLADYSVGKRLSDLYQVYGGNVKDSQSNAAEENNKITSRYGKKGDVYSLGLLVFSLAVGDVIIGDVKEIPASLPPELRDFLS
ncbi:Eukaryotic translation initiation factor 2-alpha kinase 4, partial [Stylophora pistillata]